MNDEQIARAFVQQMRHPYDFGIAVLALTAIISEARSSERARCAAIIERYTDDLQPGPVQIAAREMLAAIGEE